MLQQHPAYISLLIILLKLLWRQEGTADGSPSCPLSSPPLGPAVLVLPLS